MSKPPKLTLDNYHYLVSRGPNHDDIIHLANNPTHALQVIKLNYTYVSIIVDEDGDGPICPLCYKNELKKENNKTDEKEDEYKDYDKYFENLKHKKMYPNYTHEWDFHSPGYLICKICNRTRKSTSMNNFPCIPLAETFPLQNRINQLLNR